VAARLTPRDYPIGTKRICADTHYFETFNRDNTTLVDIRYTPIEEVVAGGIVAGGKTFDVDSIVFATGFDAMTGALLNVDINGRGGVSLRVKWEAGPRAYLGLATAGFPNLFMITGPGSPSVLSNMIVSIEQHVDWLTDCIGHLRARQLHVIEPTREAEDAWVEHVNKVAHRTLYPRAASWYMGANIPGKRASSCPISVASGAIGRNARISRRRTTRVSASPRRPAPARFRLRTERPGSPIPKHASLQAGQSACQIKASWIKFDGGIRRTLSIFLGERS
jgi:hypothetical protein